jgi:hypothetical protein
MRCFLYFIVDLALGAVVLATLSIAARAAPPHQLLGKSVVVTWSESRIQRDEGESNFKSVNANHNMSLYISESGRVFSRLTNTTQLGSGKTEQVQGQATAGPTHATRVPTFSGQSMTLFAPFTRGGMRRLLIDFDGNFESCAAKISYAKQVGAQSVFQWSPIIKRMVEVQSITMSDGTCSVRNGNVFSGE